jgi:hypothetical protein
VQTDIIVNWAAEGVALCFLHTVDSPSTGTPTDGAEAFCGTSAFSRADVDKLYRALLARAPQPGSDVPAQRVFQILGSGAARPLFLSWPPQRESAAGRTGAPVPGAEAYARIAREYAFGGLETRGSDSPYALPRTSCTRRFQATRRASLGAAEAVESVFIPHGTPPAAPWLSASLTRRSSHVRCHHLRMPHAGPCICARTRSGTTLVSVTPLPSSRQTPKWDEHPRILRLPRLGNHRGTSSAGTGSGYDGV